MTISYSGTSTSVTSTVFDTCSRPSASEIVTISRATPDKLETWNVSTRASVATFNLTTTSQANSVCMVSNASACVFTGTTTMNVVDIDNNYVVAYTGVLATRTATKGQQSAGLAAYNVAISTTNTANTVNKFNSSTFAASQQTVTGLSGFTPTSILALTDSFLIGTDGGLIAEVDASTFATVKVFQIPQQLDRTTLDRNYVTGLSYYNGIVLASTSVGKIYQIDWMTLTELNVSTMAFGSSTSPQGASLCDTSSGVTLMSIYNAGTGVKIVNYVAAIDYRVTPPKIDDVMYVTTAQNIIQTGLQNGIGWGVYQNGSLFNFTVVPTTMTTQTPSILYNSEYQVGQRILIIDDGTTRVESDIVLPADASTTYTVTPGKTVIDAAFINTGVDKLGSVSRYNT